MSARPLRPPRRLPILFPVGILVPLFLFLSWMGGLERVSAQASAQGLRAIPLESDVVPELAALEAEIDAEIREKAELPYEEAMSDLAGNYVKALTREMEVLRKSGQLETAEALKAEIQSFVSGSKAPPTNDAAVPAELQRLRTTFRKEQARHREVRESRMEPLVESYDRKAEDLEFRLTRDGRIAEAKSIEKAKALYWLRRSNLAVVSCEGEIAKFENGIDAFSNRSYPWVNLPDYLPEMFFIQNVGGAAETRKIRVIDPGVVFVGAGTKSAKDLEALEKLGFLKLQGGFNYRDAGNSPMTLFARIVDRTLELPPAESFSGFVIIGDLRP